MCVRVCARARDVARRSAHARGRLHARLPFRSLHPRNPRAPAHPREPRPSTDLLEQVLPGPEALLLEPCADHRHEAGAVDRALLLLRRHLDRRVAALAALQLLADLQLAVVRHPGVVQDLGDLRGGER